MFFDCLFMQDKLRIITKRSLRGMSRVHYPGEVRTFRASAAARHPTTGENSSQEAGNMMQK